MSFHVNKDRAMLQGLSDKQVRYLDEIDGQSDGSIIDSVFNIAKKTLSEYAQSGRNDEKSMEEMWTKLTGILSKLKFNKTETVNIDLDTNNDGIVDEEGYDSKTYNDQGYMTKHSYKNSIGVTTRTYEYNKNGQRTYCREDRNDGNVFVYRYEYNDKGKLLRYAQDKEGVGLLAEVKFEYNDDGNVSEANGIRYDTQGHIRSTEVIDPEDCEFFFQQPVQYYDEE